jgi:tight adherence protein C
MDELLPLCLLAGAAVVLVVYALMSQANEKAVVRSSLRQLEGYEVENVRDQELLIPLRERALLPVAGALTKFGRRFTPVGYTDNVRKKFIYAGEGSSDAIDKFLAMRVVCIALIIPVWIFFFGPNPLGIGGTNRLLVCFMLSACLWFLPDSRLNRKVEERQKDLRLKLPDVLDLLTISVEAGLGFDQALDRTISAVPGPLSDEFARMLGETRAGATRADAMRALEQRTNVPELRSFVLAILQADTFGVSIGRVLRAQADEMRIKRRQLAQERAQKAPVKMLIPMVFCIFPALFVIVLGPAIINIRDAFST